MPEFDLTPRRRRILTLRHRDTVWQESLDLIFDKDGKPLTYDLFLVRDGYGTRQEAFDRFEQICTEELELMVEARPEEGAAAAKEWQAWFANRKR